ncbi:MoaD/ThiS family protein [Sphingobacterium sp. 1.A.5]|uniref:MoaD/ThiS family protein n=1 Tax=Sphingobacterium sp. 1.A.5 TaxID=2044604 RepID=UPI000C0BD7B7|nr:MoaD/ThiS family protein [Sphingobacterium sp. 1.A.5]
MRIKLLAFGIVKEIFSSSELELEVADGIKLEELKSRLEQLYPELARLKSYFIAINEEYGQCDQVIESDDEIAVIPPVSGG